MSTPPSPPSLGGRLHVRRLTSSVWSLQMKCHTVLLTLSSSLGGGGMTRATYHNLEVARARAIRDLPSMDKSRCFQTRKTFSILSTASCHIVVFKLGSLPMRTPRSLRWSVVHESVSGASMRSFQGPMNSPRDLSMLSFARYRARSGQDNPSKCQNRHCTSPRPWCRRHTG